MFWKEARGLAGIPTSSKIAVTGFLVAAGIGYLLGFANIYLTYSPVDEKPGMSVKDVAFAFYGKRESTKLEKSVDGSMKTYFKSEGDYKAVKTWLAAGGTEAGFAPIKPIFDSSCTICHSSASRVADVVTENYADVLPYLAQDTGKSVGRLVSISHTHLLATAPLLFLLAFVFAFARYPERLKVVVMAFAASALLVDIGSWWLAKLSAGLAVLVILGGIMLALSFAALILLSLSDLWLRKES